MYVKLWEMDLSRWFIGAIAANVLGLGVRCMESTTAHPSVVSFVGRAIRVGFQLKVLSCISSTRIQRVERRYQISNEAQSGVLIDSNPMILSTTSFGFCASWTQTFMDPL